ncbi:MAG: hypothetical protein ACI9J3_001916 [Parvicellaceae bacterium]|jgi:hypothetical protein
MRLKPYNYVLLNTELSEIVKELQKERELNWHDHNWLIKLLRYRHWLKDAPERKNTEVEYRWALKQRALEKKGTLPAWRGDLLDLHGFKWSVEIKADTDRVWKGRFDQLVRLQEQTGLAYVSTLDKTNKQLSAWVNTQRLLKRKGQLSKDRISKLNKLGILWSEDLKKLTRESWMTNYKELIEFKELFGNLRLGGEKTEYRMLSGFADRQRQNIDRLTTRQVNLLNKIGFKWSSEIESDKDENWMAKYRELVKFKRVHAHLKVPSGRKDNPDLPLARFVEVTRKLQKEGKLPEWKVGLMDHIGFPWSWKLEQERMECWMNNYNCLKKYFGEHGHSNVPENWQQDKKLANWVAVQRQYAYRLSGAKELLLEDVGFVYQFDKSDRVRNSKGRFI